MTPPKHCAQRLQQSGQPKDRLLRSDERGVISSSISPVELELGRLRELTRIGRYSESLAAARALATNDPTVAHHRDVLYLIATNQRCLNQVTAALTTLDLLEQHHPRYSRLFQERGYCFVTDRSLHA